MPGDGPGLSRFGYAPSVNRPCRSLPDENETLNGRELIPLEGIEKGFGDPETGSPSQARLAEGIFLF